jgi:hypothetical protein
VFAPAFAERVTSPGMSMLTKGNDAPSPLPPGLKLMLDMAGVPF